MPPHSREQAFCRKRGPNQAGRRGLVRKDAVSTPSSELDGTPITTRMILGQQIFGCWPH
jgi:hypothetical protein